MNPRDASPFGELLQSYRTAAGWSQEQLAEQAGLSVRGISDLERGLRRTPYMRTVRMLADSLDLDPSARASLLAAARPLRRLPSHSNTASGSGSPLPEPPTELVGRDREVAAVVDLLNRDAVRLVTLVGPGGVGKTRLALAAARQLADQFADGPVFVDLAPIRDPGLVLSTVAAAIGVRDTSACPLGETLATALAHLELLVVLDNCEQVVEAAPEVGDLLAACPGLRILVTSRAVLRVAGEHVYMVPPLALPDAVAPLPPTELAQSAAFALFVSRAEAADSAFVLTVANAAAVAALVHRLEGLPLAIELAAARIRVLPPAALLARLERRLPLLTGGARNAPARQRTMRDTIAWSHELLPPAERALFRRLSVFTSGFTLQAAEMVSNPEPGCEVVDRVAALVDQSLLQSSVGPDDEPRYRMLETVREFGAEQLTASGEEAEVRDAHATWCLQLAHDAESGMEGPGQVAWLARLDLDHSDVRAALSWLVQSERIDEAQDIVGSLWFYEWIRGHYAESRRQFEELMAHPRASTVTVSRGKALVGLGVIAAHQGDTMRALQTLGEAVKIFRAVGERRYLSLALNCEGAAYLPLGHLEVAEARMSESMATAESVGDMYLAQAALANLGLVAMNRGQWELARERMEASVQKSRSIRNAWSLALGLLNLGYMDLDAGCVEAAERRIGEAIPLIEQLGDKRDLPMAYAALAEVARHRGNLEEATARFGQALQAAQKIGDPTCIAEVLAGSARVAYLEGDLRAGIELMHEAIHHFCQVDDRVAALMCLDTMAEIALALGDARHAAWCLGAVHGTLERQGQSRRQSVLVEHEARVRAVIDALGDQAYTQAWSMGRALDADAVLAEARAWRPPEPAPQTSLDEPLR